MSDRQEFIKATAEFLGGPNQALMSAALVLPSGQLKIVADLWSKMRAASPVFGWATVEETEQQLTKFLIGDAEKDFEVAKLTIAILARVYLAADGEENPDKDRILEVMNKARDTAIDAIESGEGKPEPTSP